ncbi:MAG TPA: hypothetical protein VF184_07885, partial [Phycisphaeraceae bacterium]
MPHIPNPPSPYAKAFSEYIYLNLFISKTVPHEEDGYANNLNLLRAMKSYGLDKLLVKHHAGTWNRFIGRGEQPWSQTLTIAENLRGGPEGFRAYLDTIRGLGYKVGVYTEHLISYTPLNNNWHEDWLSLDPQGQWRPGWIQGKVLSPVKGWEVADAYSRSLARTYHPDFVYEDVITAQPFWRRVDCDHRKPGAARAAVAFRCLGMIPLREKANVGGAVFGEGGWHWFYAGLFDGNYATMIPITGP